MEGDGNFIGECLVATGYATLECLADPAQSNLFVQSESLLHFYRPVRGSAVSGACRFQRLVVIRWWLVAGRGLDSDKNSFREVISATS